MSGAVGLESVFGIQGQFYCKACLPSVVTRSESSTVSSPSTAHAGLLCVGYPTPRKGRALSGGLGPGFGTVDHTLFRESYILHDPTRFV